MLGLYQPMSSPMMTRMLGFCVPPACCAWATPFVIAFVVAPPAARKLRMASATTVCDRKLTLKCMFSIPFVFINHHLCDSLLTPACPAGVSADVPHRQPTWLLPLHLSPLPRLPTR